MGRCASERGVQRHSCNSLSETGEFTPNRAQTFAQHPVKPAAWRRVSALALIAAPSDQTEATRAAGSFKSTARRYTLFNSGCKNQKRRIGAGKGCVGRNASITTGSTCLVGK